MKRKRPDNATIGEILSSDSRGPVFRYTLILIVSVLIGLVFGALLMKPSLGVAVGMLSAILLFVLNFLAGPRSPPLIQFDQQGFISELKLSRKTAIFDGNNIYHFGLDQKLGRLPLGALVSALRSEGYRIVCFFDANIYFKLQNHGDFPNRRGRFSIAILQYAFDLQENEIYVVPKGVQADQFIIETLSLLPVSFVVTNDRFRDYKDPTGFLSNEKQWRKGVRMQGSRLILFQHKFKFPLKLR